jgi:hypothetical protein
MTRRILSSVFDELEYSFGGEALAVCDVGEFRLGCVGIGREVDVPVVLVMPIGSAWVDLRRFEWFPDALRTMGRSLDRHWTDIPVDAAGLPSPTLVLARRHGLEVIYRTSSGVRHAEELFERPGMLVPSDSVWADFRVASSELAYLMDHDE